MDTIVPTGYRMVQDDSVIDNSVQGYSLALVVCSGVVGCFLQGDLLTESSSIPLS
jgi:hypothetical protein